MKFYSTNDLTVGVKLKEAVITSLAADGGLFMPEYIPKFADRFFEKIDSYSFQKIAFEVARAFIQKEITPGDLKEIIKKALYFDAPLVKIAGKLYVLELFHGATLSFKDFGAAFMAGMLSYFLKKDKKQAVILVATSGDTGSAVARAFLNLPSVRVVLLYPSKKVSKIQEKQLTTMGNNITVLEVLGTFDNCQRMVKEAFVDAELKRRLNLVSANSINIARLIAQVFYYFYAYAQLGKRQRSNVVFSVPSGNFGNLTAGLIAKKMGLPVKCFVAATNKNNIVPHYLATGEFKSRPSQKTISNAMDVGNPSNFARMKSLYENSAEKMRKNIFGAWFSDSQTKAAIKEVYSKYGYLMDPHGATAWLGLEKYQTLHPETTGIFLETAHPAKFLDIVEPLIKVKINVPARLQKCFKRKKTATYLPNSFKALKEFLRNL